MTESIGQAMIRVLGPARVINLAERADRRSEMRAELAAIGLATGGPGICFHPASRPTDAGGFPTIGTRGCFESHLAVLRAIAEGPDPSGLILEDDADFTPHLAAGLRSAEGTEWDMLYGFYGGEGHGDAPPGLIRLNPDDQVICAHFLAVRRETARRLVPCLEGILSRPIGHPEGGAMHVDGAYNWFRRQNPDIRALAARPPLAVQRPSRSDIASTSVLDRFAPTAALRALLRRLKRKIGLHMR